MKTLSLYWFDIDPQTVSVLKADGTRRTRNLTQRQVDRLDRVFSAVRGRCGRGEVTSFQTFLGRTIYRNGKGEAWLQ